MTTFTYDDQDRQTTMVQQVGTYVLTTTFEYDKAGNLTGVVDPLGNLTTYSYNSVNEQTEGDLPVGLVLWCGRRRCTIWGATW